MTGPTTRLASYAVCAGDGLLLVVAIADPSDGAVTWTLPGGGVEPLEDPMDTVVREVAEETGRIATVTRLLGVDSRIIPAQDAVRGVTHQNIGVFYEVALADGVNRDEPSGDTTAPTWFPLNRVPSLRRSGLVDVGLELLRRRPDTGHVSPPAVGGLIRH